MAADAMRVVERTFVPTLTHAERAANVVTEAGAGSVLLFGSVARGEAHRHSDIDLMVIFDDLDYAARYDLTMELEELAHAEVGCPVDVHLTDRPEWKMRTEQVVTSFESRVKGHALMVVDRMPGTVDWDKEMVMPSSDYEEAVARLRQVSDALGGIHAAFTPGFFQRHWDEKGEEMKAFADYESRLARGCGAGHLTVETAMKSLIHLSSAPSSRPWGHNLQKLLAQLHQPHKSEVEARLATVGAKNIQGWQEQARYQRFVTPTPELFTAITEAACGVAVYTADQFQPGLDIASDIGLKVSIIKEAIVHRDLYTGGPRDEPQRPGFSFDR